jgi:hypothetical protein
MPGDNVIVEYQSTEIWRWLKYHGGLNVDIEGTAASLLDPAIMTLNQEGATSRSAHQGNIAPPDLHVPF